ncbi:MAG: hypothetical protein K0U78_12590 [Actinomycetia bacterium]|nr:hypothetical protein [Actinomycetes bacterium]
MAIERTSNQGIFVQRQFFLEQQAATRTQLTQQLTTGKKFGNVALYNQDAERLLSLQTTVLRLEGQQSALTEAQKEINATLSAFDITERLIGQVTDALNEAANSVDSRSNDSFTRWQAEQSENVDNLLRTLTATLNTRVGEQYIFAGGRYSTRPAIDLNTLSTLDSEALAAKSSSTNPTVAEYDVGYSAADDADNDLAIAFRRDQVFLRDGDSRQFGASVNHEGFQELVTALRGFKEFVETAGDLTENEGALIDPTDPDAGNLPSFHADRTLQIDLIRTRLQSATSELETQRVKESYVLNDIADAVDRSAIERSNTQIRIAELQNVNTEAVAIALSTLNLQFQASLEILSSEYSLSLVNYLR